MEQFNYLHMIEIIIIYIKDTIYSFSGYIMQTRLYMTSVKMLMRQSKFTFSNANKPTTPELVKMATTVDSYSKKMTLSVKE